MPDGPGVLYSEWKWEVSPGYQGKVSRVLGTRCDWKTGEDGTQEETFRICQLDVPRGERMKGSDRNQKPGTGENRPARWAVGWKSEKTRYRILEHVVRITYLVHLIIDTLLVDSG